MKRFEFDMKIIIVVYYYYPLGNLSNSYIVEVTYRLGEEDLNVESWFVKVIGSIVCQCARFTFFQKRLK